MMIKFTEKKWAFVLLTNNMFQVECLPVPPLSSAAQYDRSWAGQAAGCSTASLWRKQGRKDPEKWAIPVSGSQAKALVCVIIMYYVTFATYLFVSNSGMLFWCRSVWCYLGWLFVNCYLILNMTKVTGNCIEWPAVRLCMFECQKNRNVTMSGAMTFVIK